MKSNEPFGPRGPACFNGPPGPQPLMSIRPGPLRMPCPNGFGPRFGPFPRPGPRDFGPPPRPRMNNPPPPRMMPPRGLPRPPPPPPHRALFPPNVPPMRQPMRPIMNPPRQRRPPPLMTTPTRSTKRPSQSNSEFLPPPKKAPDHKNFTDDSDIDFTDDSFDIIRSNRFGTAF